MPTLNWIIGSACKNGTEAIWNICSVDVLQCHDTRPIVEGTGGKDTVRERLLKPRVHLKQCLELVFVLLVKLQGVKREAACREQSGVPFDATNRTHYS